MENVWKFVGENDVWKLQFIASVIGKNRNTLGEYKVVLLLSEMVAWKYVHLGCMLMVVHVSPFRKQAVLGLKIEYT